MPQGVKMFNSAIYDEIIKEYQDGMSQIDLAIKYNCNRGTIYNILKRRNIQARPQQGPRLYPLNEKIFDTIVPKSAYLLGLIVTDGNLADRSYTHGYSITITSKDYEISEIAKRILETTREPYHDKRGNGCFIVHIDSRHIYEKLLLYGLTPAKSLTIEHVLNVPSDQYPHLFRGIVDGDGSISRVRWGESLEHSLTVGISTASLKFAEWMKSVIEREVHISPMIRTIEPDGSAYATHTRYRLELHDKLIREPFLRWIYPHNTESYFLRRKAVRANEQLYGELSWLLGDKHTFSDEDSLSPDDEDYVGI
jgi:hypothetical protein